MIAIPVVEIAVVVAVEVYRSWHFSTVQVAQAHTTSVVRVGESIGVEYFLAEDTLYPAGITPVVGIVAGVPVRDVVPAPAAPIPAIPYFSQTSPPGIAEVAIKHADIGVHVSVVVVQDADGVPCILPGRFSQAILGCIVVLVDVDGSPTLVPVPTPPVVSMGCKDAEIGEEEPCDQNGR